MQIKGRGRPREFDREEALGRAVGAFHQKGFDATSLDELASAMSMNRPSIYNAFGDKESVYLSALDHFTDHLKKEVGKRIASEATLEKALTRAYQGALDVYFSEDPARGCFVFCTAPVEALAHPEIQEKLQGVLKELDTVLEMKFRQAQESGEISSELNATLAAQMAQSVLHSLAIRARAGDTKASLLRFAKFAVAQLCGAPTQPPQLPSC